MKPLLPLLIIIIIFFLLLTSAAAGAGENNLSPPQASDTTAGLENDTARTPAASPPNPQENRRPSLNKRARPRWDEEIERLKRTKKEKPYV